MKNRMTGDANRVNTRLRPEVKRALARLAAENDCTLEVALDLTLSKALGVAAASSKPARKKAA